MTVFSLLSPPYVMSNKIYFFLGLLIIALMDMSGKTAGVAGCEVRQDKVSVVPFTSYGEKYNVERFGSVFLDIFLA